MYHFGHSLGINKHISDLDVRAQDTCFTKSILMIVSILSGVGSQGLLKLFQIRLQIAAFIYKTRKSRSFSMGLFLGYSRNLQSIHLFPGHLLLAGPLRRSCLQKKRFCLREEEEFRTIYCIQTE